MPILRKFCAFALLSIVSVAAFAQPTARTGARMAYHEESNRIILFGGLTPFDSSGNRFPLGDTWEWNGLRWVRLIPSASPSARSEFVMVYDSNRSRILLFGGTPSVIDQRGRNIEVVNDTWAFDNGTWSEIATPASPPARRLAGAAFDPVRDRMVLFGGLAAESALLTDTWEFDGTTWTLVSESGPRVSNPVLAYDKANNNIVMLAINETNTAEMYRYTGTSWEKLTLSTMPQCVAQGALLFHDRSGRVIQYGGLCPNGLISNETWQWDGSVWGRVATSISAGGVFGFASAYDMVRQEIIIFGGDSFGPRNSTFRFIPDQWQFVFNEFTPAPRSLMVFETDPVRGVIWMYGGQNESDRFNDLWSYAFGRWDKITAANAPTVCGSPVGAFDKDRGRLVLLCEDSSTFEWDGAMWTTFPNLTTKPDVRRLSSMVYDEQNKKVMVFGGYDGTTYSRDTWTWDGRAWTEVKSSKNPPARSLAIMFYDASQRKVFLYGGIGRPTSEDAIRRYSDMWSFDGRQWTEMKNVTTPPARYGSFVTTEPVGGKIVMFGGKDEREKYLDEHWEWDGTSWKQVDSANRPSPRLNGRMALDPTRQELALFGGYAGGYFSEVWSLNGNRWELRPDLAPGRRRPATSGIPEAPQFRPGRAVE